MKNYSIFSLFWLVRVHYDYFLYAKDYYYCRIHSFLILFDAFGKDFCKLSWKTIFSIIFYYPSSNKCKVRRNLRLFMIVRILDDRFTNKSNILLKVYWTDNLNCREKEYSLTAV